MANGSSLVLKGIRRIDLMELTEELPEGAVTPVAAADTGEGTVHGQPVSDLAVIVALSLPTIQALAIWLAKRRIRSTDEQQLTFIRDVNGTITLTVRRDITTNDARPPDQSEIEAIGAQLRALLPSDPAGQ